MTIMTSLPLNCAVRVEEQAFKIVLTHTSVHSRESVQRQADLQQTPTKTLAAGTASMIIIRSAVSMMIQTSTPPKCVAHVGAEIALM